MEISKELAKKAKEAKTAEELVEIAKKENISLSAEDAEKYFAPLKNSGELSDEELNNVSGGCGEDDSGVTWGRDSRWDEKEIVEFEFAIGARVTVYLNPTTRKNGTIQAKGAKKDDWGWYAAYLIHYDDASLPDEWYAQATVGLL